MDLSLLVAAFTVSLLHTMIPSHWLCFVLVGRTQGWKIRRTMAVAAIAGAFHVLSTLAVGVLFGVIGRHLWDTHTLENISGFVLIALGLLYLVLHMTHFGHHHEQDRSVADKTAMISLIFAVTISPCSMAIPMLAIAATNWIQVALIGTVLLVTTVGNMILLVGLTGLGIEKLQFRFFDRYEKLILGLVLGALGAFILIGHSHHAH